MSDLTKYSKSVRSLLCTSRVQQTHIPNFLTHYSECPDRGEGHGARGTHARKTTNPLRKQIPRAAPPHYCQTRSPNDQTLVPCCVQGTTMVTTSRTTNPRFRLHLNLTFSSRHKNARTKHRRGRHIRPPDLVVPSARTTKGSARLRQLREWPSRRRTPREP
jgi:hypothetical protein